MFREYRICLGARLSTDAIILPIDNLYLIVGLLCVMCRIPVKVAAYSGNTERRWRTTPFDLW